MIEVTDVQELINPFDYFLADRLYSYFHVKTIININIGRRRRKNKNSVLSVFYETKKLELYHRKMAEPAQRSIWESVIEMTKEAQEKGSDPLLWAIQLSSYLNSAEVCVSLPSIELADVLVSYICWDNNVPIMWKFLDRALVLNIVPPMLVLALLSTRFAPLLFLFCFGCFPNLA